MGNKKTEKIKTILRETKNKFVPMPLSHCLNLITTGTPRQSDLAVLGVLAERLFKNSLAAVLVPTVRAWPLKEATTVHVETTALYPW